MIGRSYASRYRIEAPRRPRPHASAWKAWSLGSGEPVELELLLAEICNLPDARHRLSLLVHKLAQVNHPHVAPILDHGVDDDGGLFLTIPLADAVPVADVIVVEGKFELRRALHLGLAVAKGLAALHEAGITHGSVTAQCIEIVGADGAYDAVRMRDAGLTHLLAVAPVPDGRIAAIDADLPLLLAAAGGRAMRRTGTEPIEDVLGLGGLLFEMLTGRRYLALLDAAGPTPLARDRAVAEALEGVPAIVVDLLRTLTAQRRDARLEGAAAAAAAIRHIIDQVATGADAAVNAEDDELPPRPPPRAAMLGMGPPAELDVTRAANAAARRKSSAAAEPVTVDELHTVVDGEDDDELPPGRPDRQRRETRPGVAMEMSTPAHKDPELELPPSKSSSAPMIDDEVSFAATSSIERQIAAKSRLAEFAATAASGSALGPEDSDGPALTRISGSSDADPVANRAVTVPTRKASASRRAFDDLPLPAPRQASATRGDGFAPRMRTTATPADGAARPSGDVGALDMPSLPNRRATRSEMRATTPADVAAAAVPAPVFGVRAERAAQSAEAARQMRTNEPRPAHHTTDISSAAQEDVPVGARSWRSANFDEDDFDDAASPQPSPAAAAPGMIAPKTPAPASPPPSQSPPMSPPPPRSQAAAPTPSPAASSLGASTRTSSPKHSSAPDGASLSATGAVLPWRADTDDHPGVDADSVGIDADPTVALAASKKRRPQANVAAAPTGASSERPVSGALDTFFDETGATGSVPHAAVADAAGVPVAPGPPLQPAPRWPLWLAAAAIAGVALWAASEAGFLGSSPVPRRTLLQDEAPVAALAEGEEQADPEHGEQSSEGPGEPGERAAPGRADPEPTQPAVVAGEAPATAAAPAGQEPAIETAEAPKNVAAGTDTVPPPAAVPESFEPGAPDGAAADVGTEAAREPEPAAKPAAEPAPETAPAPVRPAQPAPATAAHEAAPEAARPATPPPTAAQVRAPPVGMIEIPAGRYPTGCHPQLEGCATDAMPMRTQAQGAVAFDEHEVRVDAYAACVASGVCSPAAAGPNCNAASRGRGAHPINCVTRDQASAFCTWRAARLPTEAEWEVAARGPTQRRYPWGSQYPSCAYATMAVLYGAGCGTKHTSAAGEPPEDMSWSGIRGLGSNVAEWTSTSYAPYLDGEAFESTDAVVRGGHFADAAAAMPLVWQRRHLPATTQSPQVGFRCAVDVVPSARP